jgi:hypothetical protein
MEFYVPRSEKRQLETHIISGTADAFSLAASPIEKQDESIARNTLPGAGKPEGRTGSIVAFATVRSFLLFQALRARLLSLDPFLLRPTIHEKTRQRADYGGQAGTNWCEQNLPFGSVGASPIPALSLRVLTIHLRFPRGAFV